MHKFEHTYFSTFTIERWIPVFDDFPEANYVILDAFLYAHRNWGVQIFAFVIMPDHLHILWTTKEKDISELAFSFKSHTGRSILQLIRNADAEYLDYLISKRKDRKHKLWKLRSYHFHVYSKRLFIQKLRYIHRNPTRGNYRVVKVASDYTLSSAKAYVTGINNFSFLTVGIEHL